MVIRLQSAGFNTIYHLGTYPVFIVHGFINLYNLLAVYLEAVNLSGKVWYKITVHYG